MRSFKNRLLFFTTDKSYLVPTIVAARQVSSQADVTAIADIMIMLVDFNDFERERLAHAFPDFAFQAITAKDFALPDDAIFHGTHVPRSALARLCAGKIIDGHYQNIVYLDGDIQIVGSVLPLISHSVSKGKLLAAPDAAEIWWPESGKSSVTERSYVRSLGIAKPGLYFNSGVLAAKRDSWIQISEDALNYIQSNSARCRYHDQSALNAVVSPSAREYLSPRYNLNGWWSLLDIRSKINPAIIHFSGAYKPWADDYPSYNGEFKRVYLDTVREFPILDEYWGITSGRNGPNLDKALKLGIGWKIPWRIPMRRSRALRVFNETKFDVY